MTRGQSRVGNKQSHFSAAGGCADVVRKECESDGVAAEMSGCD